MSKANEAADRCPSISFQELLDSEQVPVPAYLRQQRPPRDSNEPLDARRYTSREFHELEKAHVWPRVWQLVCREEDIPEVGDHLVYDILEQSLIIMRSAPGELRALVNSCLHRGRALRTQAGSVREIRCPFHGFTWQLDGSFKGMPCEWDFQHLCEQELSLPQVRIESWKGFVFINFDPQAPDLVDYLGVLPEHYAHFPFERYYKAVHVQKLIPCNWKLAHEAFMEAYHSVATHPGILDFTGDANSQYDIFSEHVSRMITPMGVPSPHLGDISQERIVKTVLENFVGGAAPPIPESLPEGVSARQFLAEVNRQYFAGAVGEPMDAATFSELEDAILYDVFPNIQIWAGYHGNLVYQFRPNGDDHESCIFDIRVLCRYPQGSPRPPAAAPHKLGFEDSFAEAPELGGLTRVFDEDMSNLYHLMRGLKTSATQQLQLGNYQECRIRNLHRTLDNYIAAAADQS